MRALIIGMDGQDGYYLSEYLKKKDYEVYGVIRKKSASEELNALTVKDNAVIYADLNDFSSLFNAVAAVQPDEIYNLAGQSEIMMSWQQPLLNAEVNALGVLRLLEAIRTLDPSIRFFQASSSEMFGCCDGRPCHEGSMMHPSNPYGSAKLFAHNCVSNYREKYGLFACSGILFNHESTRRPPRFVTRKITRAAARASLGVGEVLSLGNLEAVRDWGSAADYVRAMHLLLQQDAPQDVVIATGAPHTVRDFVTEAYSCAGRGIFWTGTGLDETARYQDSGELAVRIDEALVRKPLLDRIVADPKRLHEEMKFRHEVDFHALVSMMVEHDIKLCAQKNRSDMPRNGGKYDE